MAGGDVLLTSSLVFFLHSAKKDQDNTNTVLDRIIANTVRNNGATALAAIVSSALFVWGAGAWHVIAGLVISKLYQVAFMSSLNARVGLAEELRMRRATHVPGATASPLPAIRLEGGMSGRASASGRRGRIGSRSLSKTKSRGGHDLEQGQRHSTSSGHLGLPSLHGISFGALGSISRPSLERGRSLDR